MLYRVAEVMEGRRPQFVDEVRQGEGGTSAAAGKAVDAAIDRSVWYAGWADKIAQVVGGANPVAGPYFNLSIPEPTGVVAVLAPAGLELLGLVSVVAPVIVTGNTVVVAASPERPLPAITLAEVLATSDVPGGVVNVLTGALADTAPTLASHMDVNAIDLTGLAGDPEQATALEVAAAENLKRVRRAPAAEPDWTADPGLDRMTGVPRDQDRLAPDRGLTAGPGPNGPPTRHNDAVLPRPVVARVVVLAGPSGVGKSRLAAATGLPVLRLDDFYRSGDDPALPVIDHGANAGLVDWDDPRSWHADAAVRAICDLAATGADGGTGLRHQPRRPERHPCRSSWEAPASSSPRASSPRRSWRPAAEHDVLGAALCLRQHQLVTFWRRLTRDLRERRKPPLVLVRRGWALMRDQHGSSRTRSRTAVRRCRPARRPTGSRRWPQPALSPGPEGAAGPTPPRAARRDRSGTTVAPPARTTLLAPPAGTRSARLIPDGSP